jgi:hypothetical protein
VCAATKGSEENILVGHPTSTDSVLQQGVLRKIFWSVTLRARIECAPTGGAEENILVCNPTSTDRVCSNRGC